MAPRRWTELVAGAALLALGGAAAAHSPEKSSISPPLPPAPPEPPAPPSPLQPPAPPEAPPVDHAEIAREVAQGMAEARASIAEARKEIAGAREEIMREKDLPAAARAQALAALDKADRDVERVLVRERD